MHDGRDEQKAGVQPVLKVALRGMPCGERPHTGSTAMYGFKDAAPGKGAEGCTKGSAVDGKFFGEHPFGRQTFEQLPAPVEKGLLQLLFDEFLLTHDNLKEKNSRTALFLFLLLIRKRDKSFVKKRKNSVSHYIYG